jgi:LL-diaminopimelate aminotransferase
MGFKCEKPKGTFYVWLNCAEDSLKFATKLLEKGVVVTPGIGFGSYGEHYVRSHHPSNRGDRRSHKQAF